MDPLSETFEERLQEIDAYLDLLDALERELQSGPPKIGGTTITAQQQKILYSSVYLQLYNLVEATVTWCVEAVCAATADRGRWFPGDLADGVRREWIRAKAFTHSDLNQENRLKYTVQICDTIIRAIPILEWEIERMGNWDDQEIEKITERLGCELRISPDVRTGIKRKVRDDKRPLELVKDLRNRLAHGSLSFTECGSGVTARELRDIKDKAARYLREVVDAFKTYLDSHNYLTPARRPAGGGA